MIIYLIAFILVIDSNDLGKLSCFYIMGKNILNYPHLNV